MEAFFTIFFILAFSAPIIAWRATRCRACKSSEAFSGITFSRRVVGNEIIKTCPKCGYQWAKVIEGSKIDII
jgi:Zn finger protein HypA/HybF involved in hydrogenase expression